MTDAETQVAALFAKYEPEIADLGKALRARLRDRLPGLFEVVYFYEGQGSLVIAYSPTERGYEGVCSLALYPGQVRLFFTRGPELAKSAPRGLLQGSGKAVRYVPMRSTDDLGRAEVEALMVAALALAKVRPVAGARGSVILKVEEQKERAVRAGRAAAPAAAPGRRAQGGR